MKSTWTLLAALCLPLAVTAQPFHVDPLAYAAAALGAERIVKGAPYCADAIHETVQTLADGNRIVRRSTSRLCRDGEGRTRLEGERDGRTSVWLRDPAAREAWLLDPERKTARRLLLPYAAFDFDHPAWRELAARLREWGRELGEWGRELSERLRGRREGRWPQRTERTGFPTPPAPPAAASFGPDTAPHLTRLEPAFMHDLPLLPPGAGWHAHLSAPRGPGVVTALPAQEIEGIAVNGERTTWTVEAAKLGNERPIIITREVWTSPELMVTVLSRDIDPRRGETTYRLGNVERGEPDPALMKVPADYETLQVPEPPAPAVPRR
ncbi:MAG TPA: hypothetical protein VFR86_15970 [Burkholderiaceae bacterium]|nr:hypothetical protein [Burkholderiaceae bacterium]